MNTYAYVYNNPLNLIDPFGLWGIVGGAYGAISGGIGGYISGGWQGALVGGAAGGLVGIYNPFGANAASAAAAAGIASLTSQGLGNLISGKDASDPCNYNFSAAAGAAFGGALGGPLGQFAGRYGPILRNPIIGRPFNSPGISQAPGSLIGNSIEGISVGSGELIGSKF